MKAAQIINGRYYMVKVSGNVRPVRVLGSTDHSIGKYDRTWWDCINMVTGRRVTVKSAQRFRFECDKDGRPLTHPTTGRLVIARPGEGGEPVEGPEHYRDDPLVSEARQRVGDALRQGTEALENDDHGPINPVKLLAPSIPAGPCDGHPASGLGG